ncbi:hypothetical protein [Thauera humireducens]|uniref:hypothetical protein n=1 Tax=Thauera humireducens TaxID=1134435 RepID=UPI00311ED701
MNQVNVVRQTARLAMVGIAAVVMQTAHAATINVMANPSSPFAEDQDLLSGEGFAESAYARAEAGYGFGKVVANASVDWDVQPGASASSRNSMASALASYIDNLTIASTSAAAGDVGVLWFDVLLTFRSAFDEEVRGTNVSNTGAVSFSSYWDSYAFGGVQTQGGDCQIFQGNVADPGVSCTGVNLIEIAPGSYEARARYGLGFLFEVGFDLGMRTQAVANAAVGLQAADSGGYADMLFDAGNSVYWDGIADVTLNGRSVPYSIVSRSGTDYRDSLAPVPQQVPEPSSVLLVAGGLILLLRTTGSGRLTRLGL